jgi:hypothetical protein
MNVNTLVVSAEEATRKLDQYRSINAKLRTREDEKLALLYAAVSRGARVLNLPAAFRQTGLNELGQPRLAIARADLQAVCFAPNAGPGRWSPDRVDGGGLFFKPPYNERATRTHVALPRGTFAQEALTKKLLRSPVPHVPPAVRPTRAGLHNFHILFEVTRWDEYPVDPFLMRHIGGHLYVVEAEW